MPYASTPTLIPLINVARYLALDPYHFCSIYSSILPNRYACSDDWYQHGWQASGKISREDLAYALRQAEDMLVSHLCWTPLSRWMEETVEIPAHYRPEMYSMVNSRSQAKSVIANYGYVTEVGRRASTLIDTPATVFSDENGDAFKETITISFATTVTEEDELRVYYPDKDGRDEWEIRPLTSVSIAGGVATIVFPKYMIPLEELIEALPDPDAATIGINGDDDTNFLQEVDVYRVYTDTTQQALFYYDIDQNCSDPPCEADTDTGCLYIKDSRLGIMAYQRADYDGGWTAQSFSGPPQKVTIYYRAGWRDSRQRYPDLWMDQRWERQLVYFALSFLDADQMDGCNNTKIIWQKQTKDLSLIKPGESHAILWQDLANPFGTTFAAMRLWKDIQGMRLAKSPKPQ